MTLPGGTLFYLTIDSGLILLDPTAPPPFEEPHLAALNSFLDRDGKTCAILDHSDRAWVDVRAEAEALLRPAGLGQSWHIVFGGLLNAIAAAPEGVDTTLPAGAEFACTVDVSRMRRVLWVSAPDVYGMFEPNMFTGAPPEPFDGEAGWAVPSSAAALEVYLRPVEGQILGVRGMPHDPAVVFRWSSTPAPGGEASLPGPVTHGYTAEEQAALAAQWGPGALLFVNARQHPRQPGLIAVGPAIRARLGQVRFDDGISPPIGMSLVEIVRMEGRMAVVRPHRS